MATVYLAEDLRHERKVGLNEASTTSRHSVPRTRPRGPVRLRESNRIGDRRRDTHLARSKLNKAEK